MAFKFHSRLLAASVLCAACGATPQASPPPASATPTAPATPASISVLAYTLPADAGAAPPPAYKVAWGYSGEEGPDRWGTLEPDFALCATGKAQTPVDIASKVEKGAALKPLVLEYPTMPLALFNNGHTVQVSSTAPASLAEGSDRWTLQQFHLHAPSEHTLDGKRFDAEVHFVHKSADGKLAVVALLVQKGKENEALKSVFDNLPADVSTDPRPVPGADVALKAIFPSQFVYFTYSGSLTVPPCTEGVRWFVVKTPIEASAEQLARFHEVMHGENSRPLQPLGDRKVLRF
jgi:carbonic anhydrase